MIHQFQPPGSSLCGQTCVAMIAGVSLDESIRAFGGKKGGTRTNDVISALRKLGFNTSDRLIRFNGACFPSDTVIVKLRFSDSKETHWTLWHEGRFYDPSRYGHGTLNQAKNMYPEGVRMTSYLPIYN